jgi:hypothetical protein
LASQQKFRSSETAFGIPKDVQKLQRLQEFRNCTWDRSRSSETALGIAAEVQKLHLDSKSQQKFRNYKREKDQI